MFNSLLKSISGEDGGHKNAGRRVDTYAEQLLKITHLYPIGAKLHYSPEFLEDIVIETIILGYEINNRQVFSRDSVRDGENGLEFYIESTDAVIEAIDVGSFTFIVPDTSDSTKQLDYDSIARIGRGGQFMRGNDISLIGAGTKEGIPIMDTTVLRKTVVREGFYENYNIVILDPKLSTLTTKESRQQSRLQLSLPCVLSSADVGEPGYQCTVIDCSEFCIGVNIQGVKSDSNTLTEKTFVTIDLPIPSSDRRFVLGGEIIDKRLNNTVVIELKKIKKDGTFEELQLVDRLDFRASLLHCTHDSAAPHTASKH